jgi:predicted DNA-binding protein (UPF0251 family)
VSRLGVSRPTFTRIVKGAREKIANALVSGYKIEIEDVQLATKSHSLVVAKMR